MNTRMDSMKALRRAGTALAVIGAAGAGCFFTPEPYPEGPGGSGPCTSDEGCVCQPGASRSCYTGDPATENEGACRSGQERCNDDGLGWSGQCEGQVTPTTDTCGDAVVDADCDGVACGGDVLWALAPGGTGEHTAYDLAVDGAGNIIVVGSFDGTMIIGDTTLTAEGEDPFVIKLGPDGNLVWAQQFAGAGPGAARGAAIAADDGRIFVTGDFTGSLTIGTVTHASSALTDVDIFVAALDADGAVLWTKDFGDGEDQFAGGIATRDQGDKVLLTGTFDGSLDFGGSTLSGHGGSDVYLAQLLGNGNHDWSLRFGDSSKQSGTSVAIRGGAYATGSARGTFNIEPGLWPGTMISGGQHADALVMKRNLGDGGHAWAEDYGDEQGDGDSHDQLGLDIATDRSDNVLLTGSFGGAIDFGGDTMPSSGATSGFVAKLDSSGAHQWSRAFSSGANASGRSVAVAPNNDVVVAGDFGGSLSLGVDSFVSDGVDAYVFRLDQDGAHVWGRRFGGPLEQAATAVGVDSSGNVLIAGNFHDSIDLLPEPLPANDSGSTQTVFIAKLAP